MASNVNDDRDVSRHLVIGKDISIDFKKLARAPKRLEVKLNGKRVKVSLGDKLDSSDGREAYRWTLHNEIRMFPDDKVTLRMIRRNKRFCFTGRDDKFEEMELSQKDIEDEMKEQGQVSLVRQNCTVTLDVTISDITDMVLAVSIIDLDDLLPERVEEFISSRESFSGDVKELRSVLESIPVTENTWKIIEDTIKTLGEVHPLAKAVLIALSIPYNFLKNEREFKDKVKDLAEVMHFTCKCLVDVRYHTKISSAKESFVSIMKTLRDAAVLINSYESKGKIDQVLASQFPASLETYAEDLVTLRDNFRMAMVMQIGRDVDNIAHMTSGDFLSRRLGIADAKVQPLGEGCMEGTRVNILQEIRDWLEDYQRQNVLWIVGSPGAGKSTIASTIAKKPANNTPLCARFFCKRDIESLRDPRRVWRTLAHGLADKHEGVKGILLQMAIEKENGDLQDYTVSDQFLKLIKTPLETVLAETSFRSVQPAFPVFIIDALDECHYTNDANWTSLLDSLASWAKLPRTFKLVITSRDNRDISKKLGGVSHRIDLFTGDDVSSDSYNDINLFFTERFGEISIKLRDEFENIPLDWPGRSTVSKMTGHAAGLFIWADMVVSYIGLRAGGSDPFERLQAVLSDIETHSGIDGADQVDRLYARIIFEAFQHSGVKERARAKSILATVVLAKSPLRKSDLVELQSTDKWDARYAVESTLRILSPIIRHSDFDDDTLRVCHTSVIDFLLSRDRSEAAMDYFVKQWNQQRPADQVSDPHSFVIGHEAENWNLAFACIHLIRRIFSREVDSIKQLLKQPSISLDYASHHWFDHLEDTGTRQMSGLKYLASAITIALGCLRRFSGDFVAAEEETVALLRCLRDAVQFASRSINSEQLASNSAQHLLQYTKALDIARGDFQIAMVVHRTKDFEASASNRVDASITFLRKRLQPSDQTVLDDKCLDGTRTSILEKAKTWLKDPDQQNILWILGAPGSGKSTVATTLVDEFRHIKLCAKVFAKRDFADRRDPMSIWRTLAYDLANQHAGLKGSIMEALLERSRYPLGYRDLVVDAILQQQYTSIVIIIDALDECFTNESEQWRLLLQTVVDWAGLPRLLKLVITSRDIPEIRNALENISCSICLSTGEKTSFEERRDIQNFLRRQLANTSPLQLDEEMLEELTRYASGSFIWAKLVVELVEKVGVTPVKDILSGVHNAGDVDVLYGRLLLVTLGQLDERRREAARSLLATLVLAKDPLRKSDLVKLTDPSQSSVEEKVRLVDSLAEDLSSIISVDNKQLLRIPHKSFSDFLLDYDRSFVAIRRLLPSDRLENARSYLVDLESDSANISIACLKLMDRALKFNACGIKTSSVLSHASQAESEGHLSESIDPSLTYACRFWAEHLKNCDRKDQHFRALVEPLLNSLLYKTFLYWLEVLSLAKAVLSAQTSLEVVAHVFEGYNSELVEVAKDGILFTSMFQIPIATAVPHIYLSALPFCPSNCRVAQIYGPRYPNVLSVVNGRRTNWNINSITNMAAVYGFAFIPDGTKLVSGTIKGLLRIWDTRTGEALYPPAPSVDNGYYTCQIAVSPNGSQIVSDDKGVIRIWDSNTCVRPTSSFKAHDQVIQAITFSPCGSRFVTGSNDGTLKVWNVITGDLCLGPLTGHTSSISSVAYSLDGTAIASGSADKTIRIWEASTGKSQSEPLSGHIEGVRCVAFSSNGQYLASGSDDSTIRLWDVAQQYSQITTIFFQRHAFSTASATVTSLSFSPDSNYLVAGCGDGSLRFGTVTCGYWKQVGIPIFGDTSALWSVAFSPNGLTVACGGNDRGIKIWTVPTTSALNQPPVTPGSLSALGRPVLSDETFIDEDGWMRASQREGADVLFWVPSENRGGVWWPRNTVVIHDTVTKFDFSRFVYGDSWTKCRASEVESSVVVA